MVFPVEATLFVSRTQAPSILWIPSPLGFSKFSPFTFQKEKEKEIEGSHGRGSHRPGLGVAYITSVLIPSIITRYMNQHNGKRAEKYDLFAQEEKEMDLVSMLLI